MLEKIQNNPKNSISKLLKAIEHGNPYQMPVAKIASQNGIIKIWTNNTTFGPAIITPECYTKIQAYLQTV